MQSDIGHPRVGEFIIREAWFDNISATRSASWLMVDNHKLLFSPMPFVNADSRQVPFSRVTHATVRGLLRVVSSLYPRCR